MVYLYDESGICGCKLTKNGSSNYYYYLKNAQGDVVEIYNSSGVCVVKYAYDAYGKCTTVSYTDADILSYSQIKYRGYYYDKCVNLYRLGSRFYDPNTGRFISPDTIDYLDTDSTHGVNLYAYCNDNPVNLWDPTGHLAEWVIALIAGAVLGAVIGGVYGGITAVSQGASATEVLGSIGIGILTGTIMGAGAGLGGSFVGTGLLPTMLGIGIGAGTGAIGGALNETFSQLLYNRDITDKKAIGLSAGIYAGINAFGTLLGAVGGEFSQFNASSFNMWLGYIGVDYVFGGMTSAILYVVDIGRFYKKRRR